MSRRLFDFSLKLFLITVIILAVSFQLQQVRGLRQYFVVSSDYWADLPATTIEGQDASIITEHNDQQRNSSIVVPLSSYSSRRQIPANYSGRIEPMWNCTASSSSSSRRRRKKLIFVHIWKTAGSTFRHFFDSYGVTCKTGMAVVVSCSELGVASMQTDRSYWAYRDKKRLCEVKWLRRRDGKKKYEFETKHVTNAFLRDHVDILIGHFPVGVHEYWLDDYDATAVAANKTVDAQYVAFFRDPVHKLVSGFLYAKRFQKLSFDEAVEGIKKRVRQQQQKGDYHERYSAYLLTPVQKEDKRRAVDMQYRVDTMMSNLIDYGFLVGIVERMGASLELIQHTIDGTKELQRAFAQLDTTNTGKSNNSETTQSAAPEEEEERLVVNKSRLSTADIVNELLADEDFVDILKEHLKYEYQLYSFALELHERQYAWLRASTM